MRRLRLVSLTLALLAVALLTVAGCGQTAISTTAAEQRPSVDKALHAEIPAALRERGVLVVGTDPSYAPMSSYAANGRTIVGMEADLAKAIGEVLGIKVQMRGIKFDNILTQVGTPHFDIALSAMTDTPKRARQVDFVDYFRAGTAILVQRGNPHRIHTLADLCGKPVSVESGTVQVDLLQRQQSKCGAQPIRIGSFASNSDALLRVRTGRADAVLIDLPPAALLAHGSRSKQFYELASSEQYEPGNYGLAVNKNDPAMRALMVKALRRLHTDGSYHRILAKWGLQTGALDQVLVNSGR